MKKLIPILILLSSFISSFSATVHLAPGSYVNPCSNGDSLVLTAGSYGYVTFVGVQNVRIGNDGTGISNLSNGFAFIDCQHFRLDLKGTFIGKNTGTTAINISGKSGDFYMKNATMDSVYSWSWVKQDPSCDTSLNNWVIYNIWIDSFNCKHAAFDGNYFGNTSPGGANASPCNISYVPAQLDSFKLTNSFYNGSARQCFQLSEASNPFGHSNLIANNFFGYAGRAKDPCLCQGVVGYLGGRTGKTLITNCTFTNGWVGTMVLSGSGVQTVTNCSFDSSGYLDGQQNTSGAYPFIYAKNLNPYPSPQPTFILENNTVTSHYTFSAQVGVDQLSNPPNPQWTANNIACNTGTLHIAAGITYSTSCGVPPPPNYVLTYLAQTGGSIVGLSPQTVPSGSSGTSVSALANAGYTFYKWSDSNSNAARADAVPPTATFTALFNINTFTITFSANAGGMVTGMLNQIVPYGGSTTAVSAIPDSTHYFAGWTILNNSVSPLILNNVMANASYVANFLPLPFPAIIVAFSGTYMDGTTWGTSSKGSKKKPVKTAFATWTLPDGKTTIIIPLTIPLQ